MEDLEQTNRELQRRIQELEEDLKQSRADGSQLTVYTYQDSSLLQEGAWGDCSRLHTWQADGLPQGKSIFAHEHTLLTVPTDPRMALESAYYSFW